MVESCLRMRVGVSSMQVGANERGPMKSILDPSFRYFASFDTNLKRTFARVRRDQRREAKLAMPASSTALGNVASIVRKTATAPR